MNENDPYYYYYSNDNKVFSNKFYLISSNSNQDLNRFHIPNVEKAFDELNLLNEPQESLNELYVNRAKQLREKYDYLVLFYSGGADSHCILETFMLNGIFIDEILIICTNSSDLNQIKNNDFEYFTYLDSEGLAYSAEKSAIPLAKYYVENYSPHTKITYFSNFLEEHLKFWEKNNHKNNLQNLKSVGEIILNKPFFRVTQVDNFNPQWKKIKEKKNVAHIWGREKPYIRYDNFGYYFSFSEQLLLTSYDKLYKLSKDGLPINHELFYIHPNFPKLFLKQAHELINKLEKKYFMHENQKQIETRFYQDKISDVIYSFRIQIPISSCKSADIFLDYKSNPQKYPTLNKIVKNFGINSIKYRPSFQKFFIENPSLDAVKNYKNFMMLVFDVFPNKQYRKIDILEHLTKNISTKKFYIKKF